MKAQFRMEWQSRLAEDAAERQKRKKRSAAAAPKERPKLRLQSLQLMLQERQHEDQLEGKAIRQKNSRIAGRHQQVSEPGWLVHYHDADYGTEYQPKSSTLQSLCLQVLAPCLPNYLDALGESTLHHYLSLLPGPALTALSVYISKSIGMNDALVGLLNQTHATRLSIVAPTIDDETDGCWKALTKEGLEALVPTWGQGHDALVRDSWEDPDNHTEQLQWRGCRRLERLELGNLPHLTVDSLEQLLEKCSGMTHLGLSGSCAYESGPEVLWRLPVWLPRLEFLDVSGNPWVTENLLRNIFDEYNLRFPQVLRIKAVGCLPLTAQVALELEFGDQFSTK